MYLMCDDLPYMSREREMKIPGYAYYEIDDLFRMHFKMLMRDFTWSDDIIYTPSDEIIDFARTHKYEIDEDGLETNPKYNLYEADVAFASFKHKVDRFYKPRRIACKYFLRDPWSTDYNIFTNFLAIPTLRYEALNHVIKKQTEALKLYSEMKKWECKIIYAYTKQKSHNENRIKEFLKTIDDYNPNTTYWPKDKIKEVTEEDPMGEYKTYKPKNYPVIDTYVLNNYDESYLHGKYFKLAVVISNEEKGINIDEIIPIDKTIKEEIEERGVTKIKAKRLWRDIKFEDDKPYYNYDKGNRKKEYITYDDLKFSEFK